jgi:hypothetical protein
MSHAPISLRQELVVGVGIEPTFRALQTRANPSQLSDREVERAMRFELTIPDLQSGALAAWRRARARAGVARALVVG